MMPLSNAYPSREEADNARDVLREFGVTVAIAQEDTDADGTEWWEVTIVELSTRWLHAPPVVAGGPSPTTHPSVTELDEYDRGSSRWDDQWERDQERRDYGR